MFILNGVVAMRVRVNLKVPGPYSDKDLLFPLFLFFSFLFCFVLFAYCFALFCFCLFLNIYLNK